MYIKKILAITGTLGSNICGIKDYLNLLSQALSKNNVKLDIYQCAWHTDGKLESFKKIMKVIKNGQYDTITFQYTALSWSKRGLAIYLICIIAALKINRYKVNIVFHDADAFPYKTKIQQFRSILQRAIMKILYLLANKSFIAINPRNLAWLPKNSKKAFLLPIGSNVPETPINFNQNKRISIFCITQGPTMTSEIENIYTVINSLANKHNNLELFICGSGTKEAKNIICKRFEKTPIKITFFENTLITEIGIELSKSKSLLFLRGPVTGARGSVIAAISTKIPLVGFKGYLTSDPITDCGFLLSDMNNLDELINNLDNILSSKDLEESLKQKNEELYNKSFAWDNIAKKFIDLSS